MQRGDVAGGQVFQKGSTCCLTTLVVGPQDEHRNKNTGPRPRFSGQGQPRAHYLPTARCRITPPEAYGEPEETSKELAGLHTHA
jgi:hypothetical protein